MDKNEFFRKLEQFAVVQETTQIDIVTREAGGATVVGMRPKPRPCADCGLILDHGPRRLITYRGGQRDQRCLDCGHAYNPETGRFDKILPRKRGGQPSK